MEFRIAQRFLKHPDFVSGVGSVLAKSPTPIRPEWVEAPSVRELESFFAAGEVADLDLS